MRYVEFSQARKTKPKAAAEVDPVDPANPKVVRIPAGAGPVLVRAIRRKAYVISDGAATVCQPSKKS